MKNLIRIWTIFYIFFGLSSYCLAFSARVIHITDGDTITVMTDDYKKYKIRLYGIDCPERKQPFGNRAKQFLTNLVGGMYVNIDSLGNDRYNRILGLITLQNGNNINRMMIQNGYAWVYRKYCTIPECRKWLNDEATAKEHGLGLWEDKSSVPPWEWRKLNKLKNKMEIR